jgi:hypothetical protein
MELSKRYFERSHFKNVMLAWAICVNQKKQLCRIALKIMTGRVEVLFDAVVAFKDVSWGPEVLVESFSGCLIAIVVFEHGVGELRYGLRVGRLPNDRSHSSYL